MDDEAEKIAKAKAKSARHRAKQKLFYQKCKAEGICPKCGEPAVEGKVYCPNCNKQLALQQHINYIKRKFGVSREEAKEIYKEGTVQRFVRDGHKPVDSEQPEQPEQPAVKPSSIAEINKRALETSEQEQKYVSYGEYVARQSGAYDWKIGGKK